MPSGRAGLCIATTPTFAPAQTTDTVRPRCIRPNISHSNHQQSRKHRQQIAHDDRPYHRTRSVVQTHKAAGAHVPGLRPHPETRAAEASANNRRLASPISVLVDYLTALTVVCAPKNVAPQNSPKSLHPAAQRCSTLSTLGRESIPSPSHRARCNLFMSRCSRAC